MTQPPLTPWSMVDDESEGSTVGTASRFGEDAAETTGRSAVRSRSVRAPTAHWALAPLTLAAVWVVVLMAGGGGVSPVAGSGLLLLLAAAGAIVVLSRVYRRRGLRAAHQALCQGVRGPREALDGMPLADELLPLLEAVEQHTTSLERHSSDLVEEQKRLALELSLADTRRRQTEAVFTAIGDPLVVTDPFDQVIFANAAAATVFGFDRNEAPRQPVSGLIKDERLVHLIRQAREADLRAANRRAEFEIGQRFYAAATAALPVGGEAPDGDPRRQPHGVVLLLRDITKEREATRHKSEFVARAAHELRTPLSAIRAYVEMLVDGEADDEKTRREYYDIIQSSADRLARMIDNILNISRIEAGTVRINKEPVAVAVIVKEAVDVLRPQAEEKKLTLEAELSPVVYRIHADRDLIAQALLNLISNAIKYTPEGGRVEVRMIPQEAEQTIRIEVADTGAGIPKEDLPRMFEKFYRVEANKKLAGGTGLGLNLVKHIVETVHEGKITLTSEVGQGSTFGMVLPLLP